MPRPPASRDQRTTVIYGMLGFVLIVVVLQLWLLTATMNAFLGGDESVVVPAAIASRAVSRPERRAPALFTQTREVGLSQVLRVLRVLGYFGTRNGASPGLLTQQVPRHRLRSRLEHLGEREPGEPRSFRRTRTRTRNTDGSVR